MKYIKALSVCLFLVKIRFWGVSYIQAVALIWANECRQNHDKWENMSQKKLTYSDISNNVLLYTTRWQQRTTVRNHHTEKETP